MALDRDEEEERIARIDALLEHAREKGAAVRDRHAVANRKSTKPSVKVERHVRARRIRKKSA